jgi:hypothetical protein
MRFPGFERVRDTTWDDHGLLARVPSWLRRSITAHGPKGGLALVFLFAGCSGKDDPKYPDISSYCGGRAQAECSKEVLLACGVPNASTCTTKRQAACVAATPPGTYNPNAVETCLNTVGAAYGDAKLSPQENRSVAESCAGVFEGPGLADTACKKDVECKASTGLRCVLRGGADMGTCQIPQRVQGGGVCSAPNQLCIEGFHCGPTQHCDINSQVGEPCSNLQPCVLSARCIANKCEKKFDDSAACTSDEECISTLCARGTSSPQGLCVSQMNLAPNEPFCVEAR